MAEATSATEKDVAAGTSAAPSPGEPGADSPRTEAQQAQAEQAGDVDAGGNPRPSDAQRQQYEEDQARRVEDPNAVIAREANPEFGGESFAYGQPEGE